MSLASRWAGYTRKTGSIYGIAAGPMMPAGEQTGTPKVELFIDEAWVDISPYVRYADGVNIRRGRSDEAASIDASSCTFTLDNNDYRFSQHNPTSPYYEKIGRNTAVRVSVLRHGTRRYRFYGEISSWPIKVDKTGTDVTVDIEAAGPMRRMSQGVAPLSSALYRKITRSVTSVVGYWPMEDAVGSTSMASAIGGPGLQLTAGSPTLSSFSQFGGSGDLPVWDATTEFKARMPNYTATSTLQAMFVLAIPAAGTASPVLLRMNTTGTSATWDVYYASGSGGQLGIAAFDPDIGNILATTAAASADGGLLLVSMELTQSGANIDYALKTMAHGSSTVNTIVSGTLSSYTFGNVSEVIVTPSGGNDQLTMGHVVYRNAITSIGTMLADELDGGAGETALERVVRLGTEEGVSIETVTKGVTDASVQLGPQREQTLLSLFREAADSDIGLAYESREQNALAFRTRASMHNQDAAITMLYSDSQLVDPIAPIDDDRYVRNDITVTRIDGSSYRAVLEDGPLSIQDPPLGIGRVDESKSYSLYSDAQLENQAYWRLHMSTVSDSRYPQLKVNLSRSQLADDAAATGKILQLDLGDRIVITSPPPWVGAPDDVSLLMMGYSERFDQFLHEITFNMVPESPYHVGVYDTSRYDTAGSELTSDITSGATSISVTTTLGQVWVQDAGEMPFDIKCGGERMTVTAVSGATSPQTFTVTRSVNGITKAHSAGTSLSLFDPAVYAL